MTTDKLLEKFLNYLTNERNYSVLTRENYQRDLNQFFDFSRDFYNWEAIDINQINRKTLRHFAGMLTEKGLKNSSISRKIAALKSFFKFLYTENLIDKNPSAGIKSPKKEKKLPVVIPHEKIAQAIKSIPDKNFITVRNKLILELFYSTGLRLSELVNISMQDINSKKWTVKVHGKGNKERLVPVGNIVASALSKYREYRIKKFGNYGNQDPLFLSNRGKKISRQMTQVIVKKYLEEVSEQMHLSPHVLRHSFATHMLDRGAELLAVKELLGHESLSTTQLYTHLQTSNLQSMYNKAHPHG